MTHLGASDVYSALNRKWRIYYNANMQGTWYCHSNLGEHEHRTLKQDRTTSHRYI
jgi:hypothetical protein